MPNVSNSKDSGMEGDGEGVRRVKGRGDEGLEERSKRDVGKR